LGEQHNQQSAKLRRPGQHRHRRPFFNFRAGMFLSGDRSLQDPCGGCDPLPVQIFASVTLVGRAVSSKDELAGANPARRSLCRRRGKRTRMCQGGRALYHWPLASRSSARPDETFIQVCRSSNRACLYNKRPWGLRRCESSCLDHGHVIQNQNTRLIIARPRGSTVLAHHSCRELEKPSVS
jgi:hypothetical protein